MRRENWFATPIWSNMLDINLPLIKQKCLSLRNESPGRIYSNRGGWQSNDFNFRDYEEFNQLYIQLTFSLLKVSSEISPEFKLKISNAWININNSGDYNERHVHRSSALSGIVYIDTNVTSGSISFFNNSPIEHYPIDTFNSELFFPTVNYNPYPGQVLIFPSWIPHAVSPSLEGDRISIAFNTRQVINGHELS